MAFSVVRKHRQLHQQRKHRRQIISFWIQLSAPILILLLALSSFTSSDLRIPTVVSSSSRKEVHVWKTNNDCARNLLEDPKMKLLVEPLFPAEGSEILMESLHCFHNGSQNKKLDEQQHTVNKLWIAGSTAAAGYGNFKSQAYGELLRRRRNNNIEINTMREQSEFPLAWCHLVSKNKELVVYDFQDDASEFRTERLREFVATVQPIVLVVRIELSSHSNVPEIEDCLESLSLDRIVYILDVPQRGTFGVPNTPDALHAHHLTSAQHERIANILQLLYEYHHDDHQPSSAGLGNNWDCATGFSRIATTGRTPGRLEFQDTTAVSLTKVFVDCCANDMNSVLLPHNELIQTNWVWDALHTAEIRQSLSFDRHDHDDWKLVVSGTPSSGELPIQIPEQSGISKLRICGECEGMVVRSATLQTVSYGCVDVVPAKTSFRISVLHGTCFISHILWQRSTP